jgi:hypothetical protein
MGFTYVDTGLLFAKSLFWGPNGGYGNNPSRELVVKIKGSLSCIAG